ncbi:transcription termination/antitermination protein NusG [uncultured Enterovirga sp.]|uniref:transcription termination/antitermination protein NusG n=1 Tax=uncultured Enterovirga sp. TaxID=2026352 RepID=UPI0035CA042C
MFNIGDHVPVEMVESLPFVEGIWRIGDSTIVETVGKTSEPEMKLIDDAYEISAPGKHWCIIVAAPVTASADRVRRYFGLRGVQTYWPRSVKLTYRGRGQKRKRVAFVRPLMFRYVFAHLPAGLDPRHIVQDLEAKAHDISGCVEVAGSAVAVPDVLIERIVARERAGEFNATFKRGERTFAKMPDWAVDGGLARIKSGSLAGHLAEIEGVDDEKGTLTVVVEMFGRATRTELAVDELCAL